MNLAKVLGTVVATQKEPILQGLRFMMLGIVDEGGKSTGTLSPAILRIG